MEYRTASNGCEVYWADSKTVPMVNVIGPLSDRPSDAAGLKLGLEELFGLP